jgi:predicted amidophosphoribosyltransferase
MRGKICLACGTPLGEGEEFCPSCGALSETEEPCYRCGAVTEEAGYVKGYRVLACPECDYIQSDNHRSDFRFI